MNKNTIGYYLIIASVIFAGAFFLGRYSGNFFGEVPSKKEEILLHRLDSLKNEQFKSDTVILRIKDTKTKIHETYISDTVYIQSLPFDSLKFLFLKQYPR